MEDLTEKQEEVLAFIKAHIKDVGWPPTRIEICDYFNWSSPNSAQRHLELLENKGVIAVNKNVSRGIKVL
jgi:repressor LexA